MARRIFINGFGRIGRSVLRAWAQGRAWPELEITGINDIAGLEAAAYLFAYDSVFGRYPGRVEEAEGALIVDGRRLAFTAEPDMAAMDLGGVDILMDCTGLSTRRAAAARGLAAGAGRVLVSGPCPDADFTVVLGANEAGLSADHRVVSNASCTTNALAPLARLLDDAFGIETGFMTTTHCYTGSQPTVDSPTGDLARSRAAALSMVPTTTSASRLTDLVLPQLAGRIEGAAVRVPTASVSAVELVVQLRERIDEAQLNAVFRAAEGPIVGVTEKPLVSSDLRAMPQSVIMALPETRVTGGGLVRVFGWYDNEWGYANRMLDVAARWG
ncbi:glyceraldehyde-3-phosphate dehydrogenase [Maritimibacter sp. 55A14]|uniref:type I glyceraldehyde-3-phosphate dehydrogenase n=1 Tax=Maritimibacter sp. 55A14 TaxID=2174844 RepID=UPI000D621018|nr:glyceraldehyde 3-phosphate dehydrogenase NAD-binding domain-containing protein [Maritimibacter sp. 55A14]PWE33247.1 glyceraldehyde-3-phosphate dehydrogenase [Maritimibacter sp. 55A14]